MMYFDAFYILYTILTPIALLLFYISYYNSYTVIVALYKPNVEFIVSLVSRIQFKYH